MASPHTRHVTRWIFFLPEFQHHIEEMLNEGHTNPQIVATLKRLGLKTFIRSLQQFLKSSGFHRPSSAVGLRVGGVSDELAEAINYLFEPHPTYPVFLLWYPSMEETGSKSYSGDAWAEESLLPGGASPVTISNSDDDLVSVNELFAR